MVSNLDRRSALAWDARGHLVPSMQIYSIQVLTYIIWHTRLLTCYSTGNDAWTINYDAYLLPQPVQWTLACMDGACRRALSWVCGSCQDALWWLWIHTHLLTAKVGCGCGATSKKPCLMWWWLYCTALTDVICKTSSTHLSVTYILFPVLLHQICWLQYCRPVCPNIT